MMKLLVPGVIAFVLGIGAGTGLGIKSAADRARTAPQDSTAADSTIAADSAAAVPPAPMPHEAPAHGESGGTQATTVSAASALGPAPPPRAEARRDSAGPGAGRAAAPFAAEDPDDYGKVARILSNMKAKDAAVILAHLSDDHVDGILRTVGVRQAAVLMASLPPERAAVMSRRMIEHPEASAK